MGEALDLEGPAGRLEALLDSPEREPSFGAVVAHPHPLYGGTMRNAVVAVVCDELVRAGALVLRFNFRGVGRSAGTHDEGRGEVEDLLAAEAALEERLGSGPRLLAGYSFGAAVALRAACGPARSATPLGLLAIAPPLTHYDFSFMQGAPAPTAVVCGELDELTPDDERRRLTSSWSPLAALEIVPGAGHDLGASYGGGAPLAKAVRAAVEALMAKAAPSLER